MSVDTAAKSPTWSSRLAFMLAAAGAAIGLGNIWKFPYIAGQNGGGAFVLFYLLCIALIGIPLLIAEVSIGRRGRVNPVHALQQIASQSQQHSAWRLFIKKIRHLFRPVYGLPFLIRRSPLLPGLLFFIMLFFAAFTSAVSILEPCVAYTMRRLASSRAKAAMLTSFMIWVLGIGTILSFNDWQTLKLFGLNFFELADYLTANIMLPVGGLLLAVFVGWFVPRHLFDEMLGSSHKKCTDFLRFLLRFIVPLAIIGVIISFF